MRDILGMPGPDEHFCMGSEKKLQEPCLGQRPEEIWKDLVLIT